MNRQLLRLWMRSWGRRQLYSLLSSLGTLLSHPVGTIMTITVLGVAMVLPVGLHVTVKNLSRVDLQQQEWGAITVFLARSATAEDAARLVQVVGARQGVEASTISPQQGMDEFRQASGFGSALDVLEVNPLPWVVQVRPVMADARSDADRVRELVQWLQEQTEVDSVTVDYQWMQRLEALLNLGRALILVLTLMFSLAVVVVIANTTRLDVASRSGEIEVLSLVGATDSFVRQPFLYAGFWYGLIGAALSLLLLHVCLYALQPSLENLFDAYGNSFSLAGLGFTSTLTVLLAGATLGFLGAWVSVQRYLRILRRTGQLRSR